MIYKVRIMYAFILSTLLLGSLIYFSFNLLGPSLLSKSTETIVIKNDIYETNEKRVSIASIANNYKQLKNKSNISDMMRQQTEDNKHNILHKNRILELESELKNVQKKLNSSFNISNESIEKLKIIETKNTSSIDKWSISVLMDLVNKLSNDKENNLKELEILTKSNQKLYRDIELIDDQNEQIFSQLEDALTVSIGPLKNMMKSLGLPAENIIQQLRKDYSGKGGLFDPITLQSPNQIIQLNDSSKFAEEVLEQIGELNLYRIAAEKLPIYSPVQASNRFTSGFGYRTDPITKKKTMHNGVDFAAPKGTLIYSTGDGIVTHAGWKGGYGLLVVIKHAFGFQTKYAHNSRIYVKVGKRVSRGDKISAMGSTGRSTGTHLHYEVRRNNKPLNPITFIKAGRNVF